MKWILIAGLLAVSQGGWATPLYSKKIRTQICKQVVKEYRHQGIGNAACEQTKMIIASKVSHSIQGRKKPLTTLMHVQFKQAGIEFDITLKAILQVTKLGHIARKGWTISAVTPLNYSDAAILRNTWTHSKNVVEVLDLKKIPAKILKIMNAYEVKDHFFDLDASDIETDVWNFFQVLHPKTGKVIGYLAQTSFASEAEDFVVDFTVKYDHTGKVVDEDSESRGYHE